MEFPLPQLFACIALVALLLVSLWRAAAWAERDALLRGKSPLFVKCAIIFFFPWGLIAWMLFRPRIVGSDDVRDRRFDLEDFRQQ